MNKQYTEKLNTKDLERINKIICKTTEERINDEFNNLVEAIIKYEPNSQMILKGLKAKLDVALEYLKENENER